MSDSGSMNLDLGVNLGVTLDGAGLQELSNTIKEISKGKDLQRYWKDVESATDSAAKAIERYNKNVNSKGLAENLLKQINALKALTKKENLSELFPNMELNLDELVESAKKIVPQINSQFSVDSFSQAFKTFDLLKEKSIDLTEAFRKLADYADLVSRNSELSRENSQFRELIGDSDVEEVKSKLSEIKRLRDQAEEIFTSFLKVNNVERTDYWGDEKFSDYFDAIRKGSLTATEAISRFKTEYAYLLEEGFKSNNDTFGLEQLQAFSNKLDSIFRQVEETSTKINDIISNGVITKSVENLSMDSSLSDSQRSLFGNLLQDEESLKSITALFQKLIEESNKTSKVDLFNDEQLQQVLSIFDKMEKHLSSLRSIISDVGDGEEFSPLLKMINNVQSSISELATSVKGIGLNMNIDVGSDSEMEAKVQSKISNALQAYQRLFEHIKMSSVGDQVITDKFFDFDINQYDTMMGKLQAYKKFIDNMRKEAKAQFNGKDVLYQDTDKSYWTQASSAMGQVTKAFNEMKSSTNDNPLTDMFGKTDLSEVVSQLNKIVEKLEEISTTASSFKEVFTNGFNVTTSVEEIDKLTNRVKELEEELSKVKLNPVSVDKSNISSGTQIKDVFQGDDKVNTDASTTAIKEESQALEQVFTSAKDAATSKEKFANANKEVKASAESSSTSLGEERKKFDDIGDSAEETKKKLDDVVFKPNTEGFDEIVSKLDIAKDKIEEISKITKSSVWSESQGEYLESYNIKYKNGTSEIRGESSNKKGSNVLRANEVAYDAKDAEQEAKALLEVQQQITKETEKQTQNQQKKWKEFQKEQADYVSNKQEIEAIERNKIAYQELLDTIQKYSEVSKRIAKNQTLDGDIELANKLEDKISELQKQPILSSSQIEKSERDLVNLYDKLETLEKQTQSKNAEQKAKAVKEEWDKNVKAIQDYMDAVTKLNNLNAKDKGTGKYASQIALQEKNVEELKEKALEARTAITSMINPHDAPLNTWNDYLDVMEKFSQASLGSAESVAKLEDALRKMDFSSLESAGAKFKSQYDNLSFKPDGDHQFSSWTNDLKELNAKIDEYNSKVKYLKENNIVDGEQVVEVKELRDEIEELINTMTKTPQAKRGWTDIGASKAAEKVANILKQHSKMSKEAKDAIRAYYDELRSGNPSQPIDEILVKVNQLVQKERELGRVGKSFGEIFKEKVIYGGAAQLAGMVGFYDIINVGREGFETIKEYDNALTEMNKVSKESIETLKDFQKESFGLSDAIGTTASQIQNSTADFLRLGESFEQAQQSAQDANALFKVAEFDNIDEATEALVAMSQAYKELDKSQINDVLNYTGNNFSISTSELASALQRSAATLKVAGNDIYEATALVTAGNAVLQDAETVGSGLKMISLRLLGTEEAKNELASLGEDVDDFVVQTQSKIDETVRSYTAVASNAFKGISVLDENGNYRSTYEILRDISLVYQEILEADKKAGTNRGQALLEVLAGKNRSNVAASILQSPELLTSVYEETMNNSQGSVAKELESQLQSIETHLNQLKNSWDKLWVNENNREVINFFLDLAKGILEVVDDIGILNIAFIGIGAGLSIKNVGVAQLY